MVSIRFDTAQRRLARFARLTRPLPRRCRSVAFALLVVVAALAVAGATTPAAARARPKMGARPGLRNTPRMQQLMARARNEARGGVAARSALNLEALAKEDDDEEAPPIFILPLSVRA